MSICDLNMLILFTCKGHYYLESNFRTVILNIGGDVVVTTVGINVLTWRESESQVVVVGALLLIYLYRSICRYRVNYSHHLCSSALIPFEIYAYDY